MTRRDPAWMELRRLAEHLAFCVRWRAQTHATLAALSASEDVLAEVEQTWVAAWAEWRRFTAAAGTDRHGVLVGIDAPPAPPFAGWDDDSDLIDEDPLPPHHVDAGPGVVLGTRPSIGAPAITFRAPTTHRARAMAWDHHRKSERGNN